MIFCSPNDLQFIYLQLPYASRRNNLRGQIFRDIEKKRPPAVRPSSLPKSSIPLWNLFKSCWALKAASRPSVETVMASYTQWQTTYAHKLKRNNQEQSIPVTSSSNTADAAGGQPDISTAESADTKALIHATRHSFEIILSLYTAR